MYSSTGNVTSFSGPFGGLGWGRGRSHLYCIAVAMRDLVHDVITSVNS